jgi:hypothetical protein
MVEDKNMAYPTLNNTKPHSPIQSKERNKWLTVIIIFLGLFLVSIAGYIIYQEFFYEPNDTDTTTIEEQNDDGTTTDELENDTEVCEVGDEDCIEEDDIKESTVKFEGEIITAKIPYDWNIIEYFDGAGTESLPDTEISYAGLTAIDIINPNNLQVFTLQAVSGIGFIGCPNYALFEDDNETYRLQQESSMNELGEELNITDYTNTEYIEFEFLDVTFRRIDEKYYYDTEEGNNYFEPPCVDGLLTLEGLYFTDDDGNIYESYLYGPTDDATSADLLIVDEILESVELVE